MNRGVRCKGYLIVNRHLSDVPVLLNGEVEQSLGVPITVEGLIGKVKENLHNFQPVSPDYDLLVSLFGGRTERGCPFDPRHIDEEAYRKVVRLWVPIPGHHLYIVDVEEGWALLAYLRIDDKISHRPGSWFDRVTDSHFISKELNDRFREMINGMYKPPVELPRGSLIDRKAISSALIAILSK